MHRFRKKSDAKRAQLPESLLVDHLSSQSNTEEDLALQLPPVSDFRTSLILPSLSKRFTLLRNSNGDPVSLDIVRSRIVEQRSRGEDIHITEEEEDIIVQALGDIQASHMAQTVSPAVSSTITSALPTDDGTSAVRGEHTLPGKAGEHSLRVGVTSSVSPLTSSPYPTSSGTPRSPIRQSNKRYSNRDNLFGSSRFHDTSYLQTVSKTSVESRSSTSLTGSDSQGGSLRSTRSLKDAEGNTVPTQTQTDTDVSGEVSNGLPEKGRLKPAVSLPAAQAQTSSKMTNEFTPQQMGRTTLALQQVIRSIEEEAEETIVVPRSRPPTWQSTKPSEQPIAGTPTSWIEKRPVDDRDLEDSPSPQGYMSSSSAMAQFFSAHSPAPLPALQSRQDITSPTPRIPGYVPGMTRPLTPRTIDSDREGDANGYSTTPRARSPAYPNVPQLPAHAGLFSSRHAHQHSSVSSIEVPIQNILPPSILRTTNRGPSPGIPLRTTSPAPIRSRGNSTTNVQIPSPMPSPGPDDRFKSDFMLRRPLSPFTPPTTTPGYSVSRPTTPSAGLWRPHSPYSQRGASLSPRETSSPSLDLGGQSRNNSLANIEPVVDSQQKNASPNVYSPLSNWIQHSSSMNDPHPDTSITSINLGQPLSARSATANRLANRVPTPVNSRVRPPDRSTISPDINNTHDPILLNRPINKRPPKRINTTTPPPQNHVQATHKTQAQLVAPVASHTPSSSNSSSNVNLNIYGSSSPMFSPLLNTSATSLLSNGSSYHSWADGNGKKTGWDELVEYDSQRSPWQEIANSHEGSETDDASDVESNESPQEVLRRTVGLTASDLVVLHKRLVEDGMNRRMFEPPRSPVRRRRMSASRASFSASQARENGVNGSAAPLRQPTPVANESPPSKAESTSRANALLDSVLNSIQNQNQSPSELRPQPPPQLPLPFSQSQILVKSSSQLEPQVESSPQNAEHPKAISQDISSLTHLLSPSLSNTSSTITTTSDAPTVEPHSTTDDDCSTRLPSISSGRESREDDAPARYKALVDAITVHEEAMKAESRTSHDVPPISPASPSPQSPQSHEEDSGEATEVPRSRLWPSPQSVVMPKNRAQLVREVSRRTAEATAALKSRPQTAENEGTIRRNPKSPINTQHISNPQFISSSLSSTTSLDAMPLVSSPVQPSPVASPVDRPANKLTDRFRKFRGSLRAKPHSDTTISSPTNSLQSPLLGHRTQVSVQSPKVTAPSPQGSVSPVTVGRNASIKASTPTSNMATAPKKSLLDIFRKPKKDAVKEPARSPLPENPSHPRLDHAVPAVSRNPSLVKPSYILSPTLNRPRPSVDFEPGDPMMSVPHSEDNPFVEEDSRAASPHDPQAMNDFLSAASKLGIRPEALNELLFRSNSMPSKHPPRTQTVMSNYAPSALNDVLPISGITRGDNNVERSKTPDAAFRPTTLRPQPVHRYPEGEVVRRTLIFANDNVSASDLNNISRKDSIPGRQSRSASAASFHSTGSAAPQREPPVPRLPTNLPTNNPRTHASKPSESSSFFEMTSQDGYTGNVDTSSIPFGTVVMQSDENDHGPALEVLELSNGQIVWTVLSSLRAEDEDDQSFFRRSMASSRGGGHDGNEDMEIRVKEHKRWDSKGSNISQGSYNNNSTNSTNNNSNNSNNNSTSRRRAPAAASIPRPETKVFRANATTIGRLIDDLSKNMDSGTINVQRRAATPSPITQSNATSIHSSEVSVGRQVERDIDALLNALGPAAALPRQGS